MSTLAVGTIKSATTSPPSIVNSADVQIGTFCRAWVNFNGTGTVAIRDGFNVSSITDNGTGDYTVNFTTAIGDASYHINGTHCTTTTTTAVRGIRPRTTGDITSSSCRVVTPSISDIAALLDSEFCCVAVFR